MPKLTSGSTFAHFTVETVLGQGGMGEVYRVRHTRLGRVLALKVLHTTDDVARARLMKEARLQASLPHPNIVAVTDVIEVEAELGVVMEFVDGPPLQTWVSAYHPTLEQRLEVFRGALAGVAAAHRHGLVHRDLKPANILIAFWDGRPVPKVADFGIAKNLESMASQASLTRRGSSLGTPRYMAPEQIEDAKDVDHRADIFSMGCVLYEICCERPAFPHDNPWAAMAAIRGGRFRPPRELIPDLPEAVCHAIAGCLVPDREHRIPDCETLRSVLDGVPLERVLAPPPVPGDPVTNTGNNTQDFAFDGPVGEPTEAGEASLPLPPATTGTRPTLAPTTTGASPATGARAGAPRPVWLAAGLLVAVGLGAAAWLLAQGPTGAPDPGAVEVGSPVAPEPFPSLPEPEPAASAAPPPAPAASAAPPPAPAALAAPAPSVAPASARPTGRADPTTSRSPAPAASAPTAVEPALAAPPAPATGTFRSADDVPVYLEGGGRRFREGQPVETGSYTVYALFFGSDYVVAGKVEIAAGQERVLRCHRGFRRCDAD